MKVYLSVASNENPAENIAKAITSIKALFTDVIVSSVYRNQSINQQGEDYYNLVMAFETGLAAEQVVSELKTIELSLGRLRDKALHPKVAIDLDLLIYGSFTGLVFKGFDNQMQIPYPQIVERSFILGPLVEICGDLRDLSTGKKYSSLWKGLDKTLHPLEQIS